MTCLKTERAKLNQYAVVKRRRVSNFNPTQEYIEMVTEVGKTRVRDIGSGRVPALPATVAANAAVTQVAVTDSLNGATFTGTALTTSATPTVDELETAFGVVGLQLNAAGTDIAALVVTVNLLRDELVALGIIA